MGRYSDSDDDRKKHKKKKKYRSRSRSRGSSSSSPDDQSSDGHRKKPKKSKHKYRESRRTDARHSEKACWRSRSSSRSKLKKRRSRSHERHRSRSRERRPRRSRSRERRSRSHGRSHSLGISRCYLSKRSKRSRSRERDYSKSSTSPSSRSEYSDSRDRKDDPCSSIPGFANMTPAEQSQIRMKLALKAAAAADEQLKRIQQEQTAAAETRSIINQQDFSRKVEEIESTIFQQTNFRSSRGDKTQRNDTSIAEEKQSHDDAIFGSITDVKVEEICEQGVVNPTYPELDVYAHPSLFGSIEEKKERWLQKLITFRRKKLEGEILA